MRNGATAPPLGDVLHELLAAITVRVLVAHVAAVEASFLLRALRERGVKLRNPFIDTVRLAAALSERRGEPKPPSNGLGELARSLGLPVHRPHHADGDALTAAQVFLALATHLDAIEPATVGMLQRLARPEPIRRRWWRHLIPRLGYPASS